MTATGGISVTEGLRKRRRSYLNIPSATIGDRRLSFKARGILAYLLDKPDGWDVRSAAIAADSDSDGKAAVQSGLRELAAAGYYRIEHRRLRDGRIVTGTAVSEDPVPEWAEEHAECGGPVPVVQQPDGTFRVRRKDGTMAPDGFPGETAPLPAAAVPAGDTGTWFSGAGPAGSGETGAGPAGAGQPGAFITTEEPLPINMPVPPPSAGAQAPTASPDPGAERHTSTHAAAVKARGDTTSGGRAGLSVTQRSRVLTSAYAAAEPMCNWPAINAVVVKAIKAGRWTDGKIRDALLNLAAEGRSVTVDALRIALAGQPPGAMASRGRLPAVPADLAERARPVAEQWLAWCAERGPVLGTAGDLAALLAAAFAAGASEQQVKTALQICGEPVPPAWMFQRALRGGAAAAPSSAGAVPARSTTDDRVRQALEAGRRVQAMLSQNG